MPMRPLNLNHRPPRKPWAHRKDATQRGYGAKHRAIRKQLLIDEPLCRECAKHDRVTAAVIADHVIPRSQGGKTERANYQPLCKACSDAKSAREASEGSKRKR